MDASRFDRLTVTLARTRRRTALRWLAGTALGAVLEAAPQASLVHFPGEELAAAKGGHHKHHKKHKKPDCPIGMSDNGDFCGCDPGSVLVGGVCCPVGRTARCGARCCLDGSKCCGGNCCPADATCCGASCCPQGSGCCGEQCCQSGRCCGDHCCAIGLGCCENSLCQPPDWECCFDPSSGRAAACPPLETCCFINSAVGFTCCPVGTRCSSSAGGCLAA
jgi:hypothetical protein